MLLIAIILSGYFVFIYFVTNIGKSFESYSLILIATVAGLASFFSPCSFPTLPAYLTSFYKKRSAEKAIYLGFITSLGIVTFNIIFGSLIGVLGSSFAQSFSISGNNPNIYVRIFRAFVGVLLILFGIFQYANKGSEFFHKIKLNLKLNLKGNPTKETFTYGLAYNMIGIGCVGPILSGLIIFAFSTGGFASSIFAFLIYSLTMASAMIFLSILVGFAKEKTIRKLSRYSVKIKKYSGIILFLVGLFLLLSSIFINIFVSFLFPK